MTWPIVEIDSPIIHIMMGVIAALLCRIMSELIKIRINLDQMKDKK